VIYPPANDVVCAGAVKAEANETLIDLSAKQ
jgi:hypothetical protein